MRKNVKNVKNVKMEEECMDISNQVSISDVLPEELVLLVLSFLDLDGILNARCVCHFWHENETFLLQTMCEKNCYDGKPENKSWMWFAHSKQPLDIYLKPKFTGVGKLATELRIYEGMELLL
jgi:hypothetical protein